MLGWTGLLSALIQEALRACFGDPVRSQKPCFFQTPCPEVAGASLAGTGSRQATGSEAATAEPVGPGRTYLPHEPASWKQPGKSSGPDTLLCRR